MRNYLEKDELPSDPKEVKKVKVQRTRFMIIDGFLYKRAFARPLLNCLGPKEVGIALAETHEWICKQHLGSRAQAAKILQAGFY